MKRLFTLLLVAACLTATAQSDIDYPYNPDFENDGFVGIEDVLELLSVYGTPFTPEQLLLDGASLTEIIESLQSQIDSLASLTNQGFGAIALNDSLLTEYLVSIAAASEEGDSTLGAWVMQLSEVVEQQQAQIDSIENAELENYVVSVEVTGGVMLVTYADGAQYSHVLEPILGCTDPTACNYEQAANLDDGSCIPGIVLYPDLDNDGIGTSNDSIAVCEGESLEYYSTQAGDNCDDVGALNYTDPGAEECEFLLSCFGDISHEGYTYSVVPVGNQCWYGENVKHTQGSLQSPSSWDWGNTGPNGWRCAYVNNNPETRDETGLLYSHQVLSSSEVCPNGWHSAKGSDWAELMIHLGVSPATVGNSPSSFGSTVYGTVFSGDAVHYNRENFTGLSLGNGGSIDPWGNSAGGCKYWKNADDKAVGFGSSTPMQYDSYPSNGYHIRCVKD